MNNVVIQNCLKSPILHRYSMVSYDIPEECVREDTITAKLQSLM